VQALQQSQRHKGALSYADLCCLRSLYLCCVTAYDKYCLVLDHFEKPRIYFHPVLMLLFFVVKLGLWITACILFYFAAGLWVALVGAVFYLAFGTVLLRIFYRKRVTTVWLPICLSAIREEQSTGESHLNDAEIMQEALRRAEFAVRKAINS
jgi:hypothetical protein